MDATRTPHTSCTLPPRGECVSVSQVGPPRPSLADPLVAALPEAVSSPRQRPHNGHYAAGLP